MTVAYAYFRYILDRENHKSIVYYYPGPSDVPLIVVEPTRVRDEMDNKGTDKDTSESKQGKENAQDTAVTGQEKDSSYKMTTMKGKHKKASCGICLRILYGMLCFLAATIAIALIIVAIVTSIATKAYDTEQSSRLVGMVMLAVTAAVTVSVSIYALVAVIKKDSKPVHTTGVVLIVVIVIQAIIAGVSVKVSSADEINLGKSLADSFKLSMESNSRHVKLWALTQSDLNCCGIYGPEDYRHKNIPSYFPPNVPISCCPTYDKERSELVQEREREFCKARKTFYDIGCRNIVINAFKETAAMVLTVTVALIIFENTFYTVKRCRLCGIHELVKKMTLQLRCRQPSL
ncbi:hypothetical protein K1T71_003705 [Dendrolimus kikuchii]|uniref:Uncharacterized protein n=1 Tax=Dendrolimus kikuchii TaxID=765133 RepID=A0ACC1D9G1_9NEOP|nr:hypothetical protein K1T71_003705 [Dendrolimus kikuchii]